MLQRAVVTELSLDHDLGDDSHGTEYDVLVWIEEALALNGFVPPVSASDNSQNSRLAAQLKYRDL